MCDSTVATASAQTKQQQFDPLNTVELNGRVSPAGDIMLNPRTPGPGEVRIDFGSRPVDSSGMPDKTALEKVQKAGVGYMEHSGLAVTGPGGVSAVQSGPTKPDGTGQNLAGIKSGPDGAKEAQSFVNNRLSFIVPAAVADRIPGLVKQWNAANVQYDTRNLSNPGPNSNTFTHWMMNSLGLRSFSSGFSLAHPLPGWGYQGSLP